MWSGAARYPDTAVQVLDKSFEKYRLPLAAVEELFTGCRWQRARSGLEIRVVSFGATF
jgi:hypothetical protein